MNDISVSEMFMGQFPDQFHLIGSGVWLMFLQLKFWLNPDKNAKIFTHLEEIDEIGVRVNFTSQKQLLDVGVQPNSSFLNVCVLLKGEEGFTWQTW